MKKILVIGDVILDTFIKGEYTKIGNEATPVIVITETKHQIGAAGRVANNIKLLGGEIYLICSVGEDDSGDILKKIIIPISIFYNKSKTTHKTRINNIVRIDDEIFEKETRITEIIKDIKNINPDIIVVSDYAKGFITQELYNKLIKLKKKIIVDPKILNYKGAYLITPTVKEALELTKEKNINKAVKKLLKMSENVLLTQGKDGMTLYTNNSTKHYPTVAKDVVDVTGAGDMVVSIIAYLLSEGYTLEKAIPYANKAAGIVCEHYGQYSVIKEEIGL